MSHSLDLNSAAIPAWVASLFLCWRISAFEVCGESIPHGIKFQTMHVQDIPFLSLFTQSVAAGMSTRLALLDMVIRQVWDITESIQFETFRAFCRWHVPQADGAVLFEDFLKTACFTLPALFTYM